MTAALVLALLAGALLCCPAAGQVPASRSRALGWTRATRRERLVLRDGAARRWSVAATAAVPVTVLVGSGAGAVAGAVAGAAALVVGERALRRRAGSRRRDGLLVRDLPAACDLLAVCLAAGVPLPGALTAVAAATGGPLGDELARVARLARLGAEPGHAWREVAVPLEPLARVLRRTQASGARAAPALHALAADTRAATRAAIDVAVRRAGVRILVPLASCFLPGFVCLGVAPLVIGLAGDVLR